MLTGTSGLRTLSYGSTSLFRDADTLGSLIDPKRATEVTDPTGLQTSFDDVNWDAVSPLIADVMSREGADPAVAVLGSTAESLARAVRLLGRGYSLVVTNPPFLARWRQAQSLQAVGDSQYESGRNDLATMFLLRCSRFASEAASVGTVAPQNWMFQVSYESLRQTYLTETEWNLVAQLGEHGFHSAAAAGAFVALFIVSNRRPGTDHLITGFDAVAVATPDGKAEHLRSATPLRLSQGGQLANAQACVILAELGDGKPLSYYCRATEGLSTGDGERYLRQVWEVPSGSSVWRPLQEAPEDDRPYGGLSLAIQWDGDDGELARSPAARIQGREAWNRPGVLVGRVRTMRAGVHLGHMFEKSSVVLLPRDERLIPALYRFCASAEFDEAVRKIDSSLKVTIASLLKVPFDIERWCKVADEAGPLPEPWSDDPTQWLFEGRPEVSTAPLQVAVARLVGYRWPNQAESDDLDGFDDADGIVCLPAVAGEPPAADRVQQLLAAAFGESWSPPKAKELLQQAGSKKKSLADWLRDEFFKQHCSLFGNRPFVWHIWDSQRDGFSALVNYHRLDRKTA